MKQLSGAWPALEVGEAAAKVQMVQDRLELLHSCSQSVGCWMVVICCLQVGEVTKVGCQHRPCRMMSGVK
jgi:hypothetical protein